MIAVGRAEHYARQDSGAPAPAPYVIIGTGLGGVITYDIRDTGDHRIEYGRALTVGDALVAARAHGVTIRVEEF